MTTAINKHIVSILSWCIIILIAWLWIHFALQGSQSFTNDMKLNTTTSSSKLQTSSSIEQYHIFGSAGQLYDIPLSQSNTSSLNLTLNGTMSNLDSKSGLAYISNGKGSQQKFKVGDKVFELATLAEIYKTYVVLNNKGKTERLILSENVQAYTTAKTKKRANKNTPNFAKHLNGNQQRNWQNMLNQQKFDTNKISSIVGNINLVTNQAGQVQGLRLSNLSAGNLLAKHGLKSNDVITAINGNRVSTDNMLGIQETLQKNPNATITIKRNGKIQNVQVNLSDL